MNVYSNKFINYDPQKCLIS